MSSQISSRDYFVTWVLYFICATVAGAAAGALVGAAAGASLRATSISPAAVIYVIGALSLVASALLSYVCFRYFVGRLFARIAPRVSEAPNVA